MSYMLTVFDTKEDLEAMNTNYILLSAEDMIEALTLLELMLGKRKSVIISEVDD